MSELLIAVALTGILATMAAGEYMGAVQRAGIRACQANLKAIQTTVFQFADLGLSFPDPLEFWDLAWLGTPPGPYVYLVDDGDANNGHGNDLDGWDEDNPGNSHRPHKDIHFVVACRHNHGTWVKYQYVEDENIPDAATAVVRPYWDRFVDGSPGNGGGNGH